MHADEMVGQLLDRYSIIRKIGQGGTAAVFLAEDINLERQVAIKVFWPKEQNGRDSFLQRFSREARVLAQLDHSHILSIYDYGEHFDLPYLVMPYVAGGSLRDLLRTRKPLPPDEVASIISQVLQALQYAHTRGLIHRDIKPGNILFKLDGTALLADFGLVKILPTDKNQPEHGSTLLSTTTQTVAGTPDYMAPEQIRGRALPASDIYAIGVVLYEMLTGVRPFSSENAIHTLTRHLHDEPQSLYAHVPDISPELDAVVLRALAKQPEQRYASPEELRLALREAVDTLRLDQHAQSKKQQFLTTNTPFQPVPQPTPASKVFVTANTELAEPAIQPAKKQTRRRTPVPLVFGLVVLCVILTSAGGVLYNMLGNVNQVSPSPTPPGKTQKPEPITTVCPADGKARKSQMSIPDGVKPAQVLVYQENGTNASGQPAYAALKSVDITNRSTSREIRRIPQAVISDAQPSKDGYWLLFTLRFSDRQEIRLIRSDGQKEQTLYCAPEDVQIEHVKWSFDKNQVIFNQKMPDKPSALYLLNLDKGEIIEALYTGSVYQYQPLFWISNREIFLGAIRPEADAQIEKLYLFKIGEKSLPLKENDLLLALSSIDPCSSFDTDFNSTQLFISACSTSGEDQQSVGPSTITAHHFQGRNAEELYRSSDLAITTLRTLNRKQVLLLVQNAQGDQSKNGLWQLQLDTKELKQLTSEGSGLSFCPFTQNIYSNFSHDEAYFALQYQNVEGNHSRISYGLMKNGEMHMVAEAHSDVRLDLVGWTFL